MDENINPHDLLLEVESLRKKLHSVTQRNNDLQTYKQQLDAILDYAPVEVYLKDREGRYIRINKQFEKLFGVRNEDLVGFLPGDIFDPKQAASARNQDLSVLNQGKVEWLEEIVKFPNENHSRTLLSIKFPVFNGDGEVDGLGAIVTDITVNVETKAELRQSNALFSQAEVMGNMGHFCWDFVEEKLISCSGHFARIYGMSVSEALEYFINTEAELEVIHPDDKEYFRQNQYDSKGLHTSLDLEYRIITSSGDTRHVYIRSELVFDNNGAPSQSFGTVQDITEIKLMEEELQQSHSLFHQAEAMGNMGHWSWDLVEGKLISCSDQFAKIYGMTAPEALDYFISTEAEIDLVHPDDKGLFIKTGFDPDGLHTRIGLEYRIITPSGATRHLFALSELAFDNDGVPLRSFGTVQDITERKLAHNELNMIYDLPSTLIMVVSKDHKIVHSSKGWQTLLGFTKEQLEGEVFTKFVHPDDVATTMGKANEVHTGLTASNFENRFRSKDGSYRTLSWSASVDVETGNRYGCAIDITERKKVENKLSYQASHDTLTGLINRSEFEQRTNRLLSTIQKDTAEHAMCFLDLDQFKIINDTCGHIAGDELLRQLGMLLRNTARKRDTLARLGGDEFGVLMEHCTLDQAHRVADAILDAIKEHQFFWEGEAFRIGVSIGLVAITEASGNYTHLFKQADAACYLAKELGRNRIHVYHPDDVELAIRQGEMQWVGRIHQALYENRFCLYAQPIVSLDRDDLKHYELLVRMLGEQGEIIRPGAFLPAAERYNLIETIDTWVVERAINLLASHSGFVEQVNFISINLSGQSVANAQFMPMVIALIRDSNIDASKVCFEITETTAISNLLAANTFIATLKDLGCRFALDDFGSGLSSFGYLKNLPVDYLKIDGMFVKDIVDDPIDKAMVKSINEIGHVMGMKTIAEFVENDAIMEQLKEIGVDYAQGYGIGKPEPFNDIISQFDNA